jgi:hypothetical protein
MVWEAGKSKSMVVATILLVTHAALTHGREWKGKHTRVEEREREGLAS